MPFTTLITDHIFDDLSIERDALGPDIELVDNREYQGEEHLITLVGEADAILSQGAPIGAAVLEAAPRCQVVIRYGVGVDNVDLDAAAKMGIPVCNVPDYGTDEVADQTLTLMLALLRRLPEQVDFVRGGGWGYEELRPIRRLSTLTLGIYGFGRIARAVARRAQGFGFPVIATDPYIPDSVFDEAGVERVTSEGLLSRADVLALHMPLTEETYHLVDTAALAQMKRGAFLVNTARGGLVDTDALLDALDSGQIAGAAVDVLETEPMPADHPLWKRNRVIITPHLAWYSEESLVRLRQAVAEEARRVLEGNPPKNPVNADYVNHPRRTG